MKTIIKKSKLLEKIARKVYSFLPYEKRVLTKDFYDFLVLLKENEKKSYEEMREYQFGKLKELVELAYNHTKFYKEKYDKAGFHPKDLTTLDDLNKISPLTKEEVREHRKDMVDNRLNIDFLSKGVTSGTTGKALTIYQSNSTNAKEWASICYQWERVGYAMPLIRYRLTDALSGFSGSLSNAYADQIILRLVAKCECVWWPNSLRPYIISSESVILIPRNIRCNNETFMQEDIKIIGKIKIY